MSTIITHNKQTTSTFYIKFYPVIKSSIGCEKATLILGRLEYWFEKYASGFYKFIEPCEHPLYREGDSWAEEIGFSRRSFSKAFDLIGVRYKSKSAFKNAKDKFQGKLYASYHDRKTNQTYFIRNHQFASEFIKGLFKRKQASTPPKPKKNAPSSPKNCRSRNNTNCRSSGGTIGGKENNPIQRKTPSLEQAEQKNVPACSESPQTKMTEEMIKIWQEEIGELGISSPSSHFSERLRESFKSLFNESLESWKAYCQTIASSKFLMGEAQNKFFKKAWITWAIRQEAVEKIRGGGFNLGDRQTNTDKKIEEVDRELQALRNQEDNIKATIQEIKVSTQKERTRKTKEEITKFSEKQLIKYRKEYEKHLENKNDSIFKEFKAKGWKGLFVDTCFYNFLEEKLETKLFALSLETQTEKIIAELNLPKILREITNKMHALKQKRKDIKDKVTLAALKSTPAHSLNAAIAGFSLLIGKEQIA